MGQVSHVQILYKTIFILFGMFSNIDKPQTTLTEQNKNKKEK